MSTHTTHPSQPPTGTTPHVLVLSGYGINCESETAQAFEMAGASTTTRHINDLIANPTELEKYQILAVPGGFSYGDDTGSGKGFANRIQNNLWDEILSFTQRDTLTIGICNGFQILTNLGLVPALRGEYGTRQAALTHNASARYQCQWVTMKAVSQKCIWTQGLDLIQTPIAHGEGQYYIDDSGLSALQASDQIAWVYTRPDGTPANGADPYNPNGSVADIAGVCDPTGRILGLMPHPERHLSWTCQPDWTLQAEHLRRAGQPLPTVGVGALMYANAVRYFEA